MKGVGCIGAKSTIILALLSRIGGRPMLFLRLSGDNIQKCFLRPVFESRIRHGTSKIPHAVSYSEVPVADDTIVY